MEQIVMDDPIALRLVTSGHRSAVLPYLIAMQVFFLGMVELVAVRALPRTYDVALVKDVIWAAPILLVILNLRSLSKGGSLERYSNQSWRVAVALVVAFVMLQSLTLKP